MSEILNESVLGCNNANVAFAKVMEFIRQASSEKLRLDIVEQGLVQLVLAIGRSALEDFVEAAGDGDQGKKVTVSDKQLKRSRRLQTKVYRSVFGVLEINRYTYSVREKTKALFKPLDERLGLPDGEVSYVLESWLGNMSVDVPYKTVTDWLFSNLGIKVSPTTAHRRISWLGEEVEGFNEQRKGVPLEDEEEILVVQADGKGVPIRTSFAVRANEALGIKLPHRPARKDNGVRAEHRSTVGDQNVKTQRATTGAFYSVAPYSRTTEELLDGKNRDRPKISNKRLWAELNLIGEEEVSRGAVRVFESFVEERQQRDSKQIKQMVCLMDGDPHLWNLMDSYLPDAIGILDLFHVMEKLWEAAQCFHKQGSPEAETLVEKHLKMLLENKVDYVRGLYRRALNRETLSASKQEKLQKVYNYFTNNRQRMKYGDYLARGFPVASGVVEGACKHIIGDRMCGTGMRWEFEGAQPMLDMRVTKLNGEWQQFIQYRIQKEQSELYQNAA